MSLIAPTSIPHILLQESQDGILARCDHKLHNLWSRFAVIEEMWGLGVDSLFQEATYHRFVSDCNTIQSKTLVTENDGIGRRKKCRTKLNINCRLVRALEWMCHIFEGFQKISRSMPLEPNTQGLSE